MHYTPTNVKQAYSIGVWVRIETHIDFAKIEKKCTSSSQHSARQFPSRCTECLQQVTNMAVRLGLSVVLIGLNTSLAMFAALLKVMSRQFLGFIRKFSSSSSLVFSICSAEPDIEETENPLYSISFFLFFFFLRISKLLLIYQHG